MRILIALTLAALVAAPALAQAQSNAAGNPNAGAGSGYSKARSPNNVVYNGKVIGRDPDPFIRHEMLRHAESGWAD